MFWVVLAYLPFTKFLEDRTTILNFINSMVVDIFETSQLLQTESTSPNPQRCFARSCLDPLVALFPTVCKSKFQEYMTTIYIFQPFEKATKRSHLVKCLTPSSLNTTPRCLGCHNNGAFGLTEHQGFVEVVNCEESPQSLHGELSAKVTYLKSVM